MRFLFAFYASLILLKVLIKGSDAVSLTSISKLHDIGIDVNENSIELSGWKENKDDSTEGIHVFEHDGLTLETTLQAMSVDDEAETAALFLSLGQ